MNSFYYLIIGGGITCYSAIKAIRKTDEKGSIGVICEEPFKPYSRPYLSKKLWKGKPLESVWLNVDFPDVQFFLNSTAVKIDPATKEVTDNHQNRYRYDKLLIATGGTPRKLGDPLDNEIIYFRNLNDYHLLRELTEKHDHFTVLGGGFIGTEIAAALSLNQKKVTMIFPEESINTRIFPEDLSRYLNEYYQEKGVLILAGDKVDTITKVQDQYKIVTQKGKEILTGKLIAGLGITPAIEVVKDSGIRVTNGIDVDEHLLTNQADIYAAGDAVNFHNSALNERIRVEHEDNALKMGKCAGENMAGQPSVYLYLPSFYSDLFDLGFEAVGNTLSSLKTVCDWQELYKKGVIYYIKDSVVVGVVLWNVWKQTDRARELIGQKKITSPDELTGLIK